MVHTGPFVMGLLLLGGLLLSPFQNPQPLFLSYLHLSRQQSPPFAEQLPQSGELTADRVIQTVKPGSSPHGVLSQMLGVLLAVVRCHPPHFPKLQVFCS